MRRHAIIGLLLAALPAVSAQDRDAVLAKARRDVAALTDPAMHGRGYFSGGDSIAAEWIAREFKRIGLRPLREDHFQRFHFKVNSFPDSIGVTIDDVVLIPGTDYLVAPHSGTAQGVHRLVHLTPADLLTPERRAMTMGVVTGNAAVFRTPATKDADTLALYTAMEHELMLHVPVVRPVKGKLTWGVAREALPHPLIEVREELVSDSAGTIAVQVRNKLVLRHQARNVLGMVKGRGKDWVVIGAHYDHLGRMGPSALFPGANDNASGVAMLLALAERFAKRPAKLNLLFVAFAGEEAGLLGSEWFVQDKPIPLGRIRMMVNLDILGTGDEGITVVNATAEQAAFDRLSGINARASLLPQVRSRGPACNSDHCPFVRRGVPAIFIYTLGGVAHYHDVHDRAETLPLTRFHELYTLLGEFIATQR